MIGYVVKHLYYIHMLQLLYSDLPEPDSIFKLIFEIIKSDIYSESVKRLYQDLEIIKNCK